MRESTLDRDLLPDVQSEAGYRGQAIQKVGVTRIRYPFRFRSADHVMETVGHWDMFVSLPETERGTHMSRFMEILSAATGDQTIESLVAMCGEIRKRLDAAKAMLTVEFPWFVNKQAPVSNSQGLVDMDVKIEIACGQVKDCVVEVKVPATSLCPCSKTISDYGAHNQRCELTVAVRVSSKASMTLEDLFTLTEQSASSQVFPVLKRDDEKWVTEKAYDNPKFAEDAVRDLASALQAEDRIEWFRCTVENFESIHSHNAYAEIEYDKRTSGASCSVTT